MSELGENPALKKQRTGDHPGSSSSSSSVISNSTDGAPDPLRISALNRVLFATSDSTLAAQASATPSDSDWTHWENETSSTTSSTTKIPSLSDPVGLDFLGTSATSLGMSNLGLGISTDGQPLGSSTDGLTDSTKRLFGQISSMMNPSVSVHRPELTPADVKTSYGPRGSTYTPTPTPLPPAPQASILGLQDIGSGSAVSDVGKLITEVKHQLKEIRMRQGALFERSTLDTRELENLAIGIAESKKKLDHAESTLVEINGTTILSAMDARNVVLYQDILRLDKIHLCVLEEELNFARLGEFLKPVARLVITSQPFPCTVKQSKSLDEDLKVKLITGARVTFTPLGLVKAELINEDYTPAAKRKSSSPPIQNDSAPLNDRGEAVFQKMIMTHGTRVKTINLRFYVDVELNNIVTRLQSDASKPFIVMTNHGQRSTTEGKLLKKETFGSQSEIRWPTFANAIHMHYLQATKQAVTTSPPPRPLTMRDFEFLKRKRFEGKEWITQDSYDAFWEWFGTILYKIRNHQKHILPMWTKGLIYGFLGRETAGTLLSKQPPGSFLIRFSDRCAGLFVVVYVDEDYRTKKHVVKHYLIQADDIEKKQTLPDFLRDCRDLKCLLQLQRDESGELILTPRTKESVLQPFYSHDKVWQSPFGYDDRKPS